MTKHHDNARIFMALCDVTRLRVLELLKEGEKSATDLQESVETGQSTLSHHMKILTESGIVAARKKGKWTYYAIDESGGRYAARLLRLLTTKNKATDIHALTKNINQKGKNDMNSFTIVMDTSCDLSPEYIKEHDIQSIPVPFTLDDTPHNQGYWQDISYLDFYNALRNGGVAKTSQINPDAFVQSYTEYAKQGRDVLYIILSGGLSGTYQSALIALEEVKETYPDCQIYPVDSLSAASLNALLVMMAVQKRGEGWSAAQTAAFLEEKRHYLTGIFTVDDLMYLHRGGRLGKLSAIGGSILGVKPILNLKPNGTLALKEKVRGRSAAYRLMVNHLIKLVDPDKTSDTIFISHTDCEDEAKKLAEMVKAAVKVRTVEIIGLGPVIGAHVGPGTVTLIFEASITREEYEKSAKEAAK